MYLKYGTAGFRMNSELLIDNMKRISDGIYYLLSACPRLKNYIGIMITASHNPIEDNGLKLIDYNGDMILEEEQEILEAFVNSKKKMIKLDIQNIIVGRDTRQSGDIIIKHLFNHLRICNIKYIGLASTPIMHHITKKYYETMFMDYSYNDYLDNIRYEMFDTIYVDCAGGIGFLTLKELFNPNLQPFNSPSKSILNHECGSDYVSKNNFNFNFNNGCSLDGDADRIIFWFKQNEIYTVLNGDDIMLLWTYYLKDFILDLVVITTPYCNSAIIQKIEEWNIEVIKVKTGIRNLKEEAKKHRNSIYFESNGHGTVRLTNYVNIPFNELIGDGIYNIVSTMLILKELNFTFEDWSNLVQKNKTKEISMSKDIFPELIMNEIGDRIIEPKEIQDKIDEINCEYNSYIFIRPSGTEPIVRIHIEGENIELLEEEIKFILL